MLRWGLVLNGVKEVGGWWGERRCRGREGRGDEDFLYYAFVSLGFDLDVNFFLIFDCEIFLSCSIATQKIDSG